MTDATVHISADSAEVGRAGHAEEVRTQGLESVRVPLAGEARCNGDEYMGAEVACHYCDRPLHRGAAGWVDETDGAHCQSPEEPDPAHHEPVPIPLSWANSAAISLDETEDRISVSISVGDPRGAFVLSVERLRFTCNSGSNGPGRVVQSCALGHTAPTPHNELRLSVPHPDDSQPHMPLTRLASAGYYRIGEA